MEMMGHEVPLYKFYFTNKYYVVGCIAATVVLYCLLINPQPQPDFLSLVRPLTGCLLSVVLLPCRYVSSCPMTSEPALSAKLRLRTLFFTSLIE